MLAAQSELESLALKGGQSQLFIETPYRNAALFGALLQGLQPNTRLSISTGLTLANAFTRSLTVKAWKQEKDLAVLDGPAVFAIGR